MDWNACYDITKSRLATWNQLEDYLIILVHFTICMKRDEILISYEYEIKLLSFVIIMGNVLARSSF
jgi:hypothetical protein